MVSEDRVRTNLIIGVLILLVLAASASGMPIKNKGLIMATSVPRSTGNPSVVEEIVNDSVRVQSPFNNLGHEGNFDITANATLGKWMAHVDYQPGSWNPGMRVTTNINLIFSKNLLGAFKEKYPNINKVCILITAERDFDSKGFQHVPWDYGVSTILTPGGLPIEGGGSSALSRFTGYVYRTPVDIMLEAPISDFNAGGDASEWYQGNISASFDLPKDLPPGIYRLRLDLGLKSERSSYIGSGFNLEQKWYNFNGDGIGIRSKDPTNVSCIYFPPIAASGIDVTGKMINSAQIQRKCYWVLLWDYNSNGYRGVVAKEDQDKFAISPKNIIHDDIILPRFDSNGYAIAYNLEPHFPMDDIDPQRNIPWRYDRGEWSVKITLPNGTKVELWSPKVKVPVPNGTIIDLGSSRFVARRWNGATTNNSILTSWKPPAYGKYIVEAKGWIEDIWGNRYYGGGNYTFWIAKRMTLATATFQGQSYPVGSRYGRDIAFSPAVPADVEIVADLYVNSSKDDVRTVVSRGKATSGGIFGVAQGMKYLLLDEPGEYHAKIMATYWDPEGNLWVCAMTHAGVVYPENTTVIAHGKKLSIQGKLVDRGETHSEGYYKNGTRSFNNINFPFNSGDVILIASEEQGSNLIVPVLTYEMRNENASYDSSLQSLVQSNLQIKTSNGLSPDMFPEFIADMACFYASAPRPGLMGRFLIAQDKTLSPYWLMSPNSFGGQYGASNNGDVPGDIYRLLGGVVLRPKGQTPMYAGYQASAFILPKGTNNNRIIGPGDEDLPSPDGKTARFFMVPVRPGMVYQQGTNFTPVLQIDPVVPCDVNFILRAPDGSMRIADGKGDRFGYFTSNEKWVLDQPGVWTYSVNAIWNGYKGRVPGLPDSGGYIFVLENGATNGPGLSLDMPEDQKFSPMDGLLIQGNSSASKVYFAVITPGAVLDEGVLPAVNGRFSYRFNPKAMADKIKTYDIINLVNGNPEIGRIVHITFFSEERGDRGPYHSFARVILRGTEAIYVKDGLDGEL